MCCTFWRADSRRQRCSFYPTPVQGAASVPAIVEALQTASARAECDVLIVARGGGSIETFGPSTTSVWLVRSVLHLFRLYRESDNEIDFTIADFVADARAPTPSGAAELVAPDRNACLEALARTSERMSECIRRELRSVKARFDGALLRIEARSSRRATFAAGAEAR